MKSLSLFSPWSATFPQWWDSRVQVAGMHWFSKLSDYNLTPPALTLQTGIRTGYLVKGCRRGISRNMSSPSSQQRVWVEREKCCIPDRVLFEEGHCYPLWIHREQRVSMYLWVITSAQVWEPIASKRLYSETSKVTLKLCNSRTQQWSNTLGLGSSVRKGMWMLVPGPDRGWRASWPARYRGLWWAEGPTSNKAMLELKLELDPQIKPR